MASSTDRPLQIAVVVGSTREGRFAPVVTRWLTGHLDRRDDMKADVVDLAETALPTVLPAFGQPPAPGVEEALVPQRVRHVRHGRGRRRPGREHGGRDAKSVRPYAA
ncbi:NAD(P)H-dependent oxidoreductase [Streptomyces sp. MZ04]|uniref:NADPH-dependent FMN reductase n=1 Tax=Streptomyces sp. MZ04 TaxID=2559236 RepID=UPI00107EE49B|nr:NAD(P)H-dependent oxidoreductase [Streptomyces sp. MZ04]TGA90150.1 hypothetical protein E2651_38815 [Streptomyces sp. MZ04]